MGSGESHTPAATARATTSVVRTALGDAFDELHPKVQWRFGLSASDERCQVGVGVMEEMTHSALIPPPMLWLGARRGLFPGGKARDVPFTIVNYAYVDELGRDTLSFVRRFSFAGSPQGMNSVMVTPTVSTSPGHALDYLGFHSDMIVRTTCSVDDDGGLVLESGAPKVLGVPTPHLASATTIGREWWDEHEQRHRIQIEVTSPVMGRLFLYRGWFTAEERPCPAGDIPASAKPTRLERRE
ncbi:DUF4166 domain-containing protein [Rhodococcus sp. BP-252]|uniref:DUF4166 domain-containing protein n=1 Tax=Rhodococcoides kyotonense TaxID=398843 RepID=A0A177YIH0_9NOCA|nr:MULTISPECIES: DUF4166 domain-containing protein [Rhodococcus]MBY6414754.1 DUF4166 domain-containing protein [Rhodococcus sp. BP-320]MBY6419658.1 DUF4166 domain-containing protein [Rhodococcus sp. BP-321]MBY6424622.1 DUF4166 domain-containing protein [Rhodococcus sp. BP-324]MBY6429619.1 DUF4166 domain-containing protein [Rhodococcus sp. BP-323]MBY6434604.1 DUF4166 domain-containing protein [Rhodococcus sp. BP-322]